MAVVIFTFYDSSIDSKEYYAYKFSGKPESQVKKIWVDIKEKYGNENGVSIINFLKYMLDNKIICKSILHLE